MTKPKSLTCMYRGLSYLIFRQTTYINKCSMSTIDSFIATYMYRGVYLSYDCEALPICLQIPQRQPQTISRMSGTKSSKEQSAISLFNSYTLSSKLMKKWWSNIMHCKIMHCIIMQRIVGVPIGLSQSDQTVELSTMQMVFKSTLAQLFPILVLGYHVK